MKCVYNAAISIALLGLSACDPSTQALQSDWINAVPEPLPSASPIQPSPSPSPTAPPDTGSLYIGPADVAKYVQKFVDDAKIQGRDVLPDMANPKLTIQIASLDSYGSTVIGLCETGGGKRRVTFDPDFWNSVSETQRELLAHHELGHCVLYRSHRSDKLATGAYASIMYPIIMSSSTYTNNYDYYQEELFSQAQSAGETGLDAVTTTYVCDITDLGLEP